MRKDVGWKLYFEDNRRYADVINGVGCDGKQFVKDTDLQEVDTASKGKARDLLRRTAFGVNFALIGIESQETVDYKFPLRKFLTDEERKNIIDRMNLTPNSVLFIVADKKKCARQ